MKLFSLYNLPKRAIIKNIGRYKWVSSFHNSWKWAKKVFRVNTVDGMTCSMTAHIFAVVDWNKVIKITVQAPQPKWTKGAAVLHYAKIKALAARPQLLTLATTRMAIFLKFKFLKKFFFIFSQLDSRCWRVYQILQHLVWTNLKGVASPERQVGYQILTMKWEK